jgi:hypothetical protein
MIWMTMDWVMGVAVVKRISRSTDLDTLSFLLRACFSFLFSFSSLLLFLACSLGPWVFFDLHWPGGWCFQSLRSCEHCSYNVRIYRMYCLDIPGIL